MLTKKVLRALISMQEIVEAGDKTQDEASCGAITLVQSVFPRSPLFYSLLLTPTITAMAYVAVESDEVCLFVFQSQTIPSN